MIPAYASQPNDTGAPGTELTVQATCHQQKLTNAFQKFSGGELHTGAERQKSAFPHGLKYYITCLPDELRLHPVLVRLNLIHLILEPNHALRLKSPRVSEPILLTSNGTIIAGFRNWHEAVSDGRPLVECIEYPLSDEEALQSILTDHQPTRTWNNFTRVRVALELEPYFQKRALANQITGGRHKGSANLPKAGHIDVREEIAIIAAVSGRTVSNVKTILEKAAPKVIDALQVGALRINRALSWCAMPKWRQIEIYTDYQLKRAQGKVIRCAIAQLEMVGPGAVIEALREQQTREPGSVMIRVGRHPQTVILLGQDLLSRPSLAELANR